MKVCDEALLKSSLSIYGVCNRYDWFLERLWLIQYQHGWGGMIHVQSIFSCLWALGGSGFNGKTLSWWYSCSTKNELKPVVLVLHAMSFNVRDSMQLGFCWEETNDTKNLCITLIMKHLMFYIKWQSKFFFSLGQYITSMRNFVISNNKVIGFLWACQNETI